MTGLETALAVVHDTMVKTGLMTWAAVAERMSTNPAVIGRVADQGQPIAVGSPAHITLFNPSVDVQVDPAHMASNSRNTPFAGITLPGKVIATFYRGRPTVLNGELA
jgi:dihydroorotase